MAVGNFENGKKEGLWISYHGNGKMKDSLTYKNGNYTGTCLQWHPNGYTSDSVVWKADGSGISFSWFDNGSPSSGGRYASGGQMHGKWVFYSKSGKLSAIETYERGNLTNKNYYDEKGTTLVDTVSNDRTASFPGGTNAWMKYLDNKIYFPPQYDISNGDAAVVVVEAVVDEEGKVQDAVLTTSFYKAFDEIALNAIRQSPKWIPARSHNRNCSFRIKQAVTFYRREYGY